MPRQASRRKRRVRRRKDDPRRQGSGARGSRQRHAVVSEVPKGLGDFGILVRGSGSHIPPVVKGLHATHGKLSLPYAYTLIWEPATPLRPEVVSRGFDRLQDIRDMGEPWEMVAMLIGRELRASAVGSKEERRKTEAIVGDLRIPAYNTGLLWVRRTSVTERVVARWRGEVQKGADEHHAFLRALYSERAMLCTMPADWHLR